MVPPGPGSIIWGSGGPWDYYLGVSWGKKGSPQFPLKSLAQGMRYCDLLKEDLESLGLMKVDVLSLGMLNQLMAKGLPWPI